MIYFEIQIVSDLTKVSPFKLTSVSHDPVSRIQEHFLTIGHKKVLRFHLACSWPQLWKESLFWRSLPLPLRMVFTVWPPGAVSLPLGFLLSWVPFSRQNQGIHVCINRFYSLSRCIFHFENLELVHVLLIPNFVFLSPFSSSENLVLLPLS